MQREELADRRKNMKREREREIKTRILKAINDYRFEDLSTRKIRDPYKIKSFRID